MRTNERTPPRSAPLPRPTSGGPPGGTVTPPAGTRRAPARAAGAGSRPVREPDGSSGAPAAESASVYRARPSRAAPPVTATLHRLHWLRQMPGPRFTGLGCGLFAALAMFGAGTAGRLLPLPVGEDAVRFGYGVLFGLVATAAALWVRPTELIAAPVAAPIVYAAGLPMLTGGTGYADRLLNLFSALALNAGWLYAGTLAACAVAAVRKVLLLGDRAARRAQQAQRTAASV